MPKNVKSAIRGAARLRTVIFSALLAGGIANLAPRAVTTQPLAQR